MSFLSSFFGQSKSKSQTLEAYCPKCQATYRIGEDATITTMAKLFGSSRGVLGSSDAINRMMNTPDLVGRPVNNRPIQEQLTEAKTDVLQIRKDLSRGKKRYWYCEKCGNDKNPYLYQLGK